MKLKLVIIQFFGGLFFVKGFDICNYLVFDKNDLEIFRSQSSFSFYTNFDSISYRLYFIFTTGLVGLIIAAVVSYFINKKKHYKQWPLLISFCLAFVCNKIFWHLDITQIIDFKSKYLVALSVKFLMEVGLVINVVTGLLILMMAKYLEKLNYYFKIHI